MMKGPHYLWICLKNTINAPTNQSAKYWDLMPLLT